MLQMQRAKALLAAAAAAGDGNSVYESLPSPSIGVRNSKQLGRPVSGRSDPELLQKLLHFVRQELQYADPADAGYLDERLDVFRRAMGHFIAAFGAYSPLLTAVQQAYEDALRHATSRAAGVDELAGRLALVQDETQQLLEHVRQDAAAEVQAAVAMVEERDEKLREAEKQIK